jgi:heme-degrading monooxygenase HmoA
MAEVCYIDWHVTPFRADRFLEIWRPAAGRALAFGAKSWSLTRNVDDPLHIRQMAVWDDREDFDRYWYSEEIAEARAEASGLFQVPILPQWLRAVDAGNVIGEDLNLA